jgi:hypothetical protein
MFVAGLVTIATGFAGTIWGATISGVFSDAGTQHPIAAADVALVVNSTTKAVTHTDKDGKYRFDEVPAGNVVIEFKKLGYRRYPETLAKILSAADNWTDANAEAMPRALSSDYISECVNRLTTQPALVDAAWKSAQVRLEAPEAAVLAAALVKSAPQTVTPEIRSLAKVDLKNIQEVDGATKIQFQTTKLPSATALKLDSVPAKEAGYILGKHAATVFNGDNKTKLDGFKTALDKSDWNSEIKESAMNSMRQHLAPG